MSCSYSVVIAAEEIYSVYVLLTSHIPGLGSGAENQFQWLSLKSSKITPERQ